MAQGLIAFVVLAEDLWHTHGSLVQRYACQQNTHTHEINLKYVLMELNSGSGYTTKNIALYALTTCFKFLFLCTYVHVSMAM